MQYVAGDVRTLFPEKSWPFSCGLSDFLLDIRLILAGNELDRPLNSVASVAETVGYQSEAAFQRVFKKNMGITPAQWRRASASKRTSRSSRT
ncbi:AraC family transcriptional regulator [Acidisoma sp. S159]|uniref:helix-turn-helix domain-containing protein n=1 Tax=Acidisoma sp. S159 TaxID=1747225 RepID=UPI001C205765|nr:helix-turn-helix domain-containing protein [Acidisoma sp. S159]